ncbi:MAG TPA: hypothetical protein VNI83_06380, partial [Vicinamibacterales bacterium]|nr:hypothetical protein [Vicinamibacterales bacterium]
RLMRFWLTAAAMLVTAAGALLWQLGGAGVEPQARAPAPPVLLEGRGHDVELPHDLRGTTGSTRRRGARVDAVAVTPIAVSSLRGTGPDDRRDADGSREEDLASPAPPPSQAPSGRHAGRRHEAHPLVRFGRLIAGDGRHRVQPFPRPDGPS